MDTSSKIYQKAIATLKKQKNNASRSVKSSPFPPFTVFDASMSISFYFFWNCTHIIYLDLSSAVTNEIECDAAKRAYDLVSNEVMYDIQQEYPSAQTSFEETVHQQIVLGCQRLRITLVIIDKLMNMYNDAVSAGKINPSVV